MPVRILLFSTMVFALLAPLNYAKAAEVSRGAMLSNSCAACHGTCRRHTHARPQGATHFEILVLVHRLPSGTFRCTPVKMRSHSTTARHSGQTLNGN